jgi:predicted SpoU family rRNA methylase
MNEKDLVNFNIKVEREVKEQFKKIVKSEGKIIHFTMNEILKEFIKNKIEKREEA